MIKIDHFSIDDTVGRAFYEDVANDPDSCILKENFTTDKLGNAHCILKYDVKEKARDSRDLVSPFRRASVCS